MGMVLLAGAAVVPSAGQPSLVIDDALRICAVSRAAESLLHIDDADAVHRFFVEHDIPAQPRSRRLRLDRHRDVDAPVWTFSADDLPFDVTVLPHDVIRQAPLSPVDEKPMRRASCAQLQQIVADAEIDGFERGLG
jgi:PAS domain-containing protein